MTITFPCPKCGADIEAEATGLKRRIVPCPQCNAPAQMPEDITVAPGVTIGNGYKLQNKLGDSSLGEIYLAVQTASGQQVKVEVLSGQTRRDEEKVHRLLQEIELVAALQHPNIMQAIEAGQDSETCFLVTAYEPGHSLEEVLRRGGALPENTALKYAEEIARALGFAWDEKRILHRDVKPVNIFISDSGVAKLEGFGIAKSSEGQSLGLTGVGFTIGTPEYMSPEQIKAVSDLDFRSDMYALGCVLYEMVVGKLPFEEKAPILLMQKHMDEMPVAACERNPAVSADCSAVIDRMLSKAREDRHETWQDLIDELAALRLPNRQEKPRMARPPTPGAGVGGETVLDKTVVMQANRPAEPAAQPGIGALPAKGAPSAKKGCFSLFAVVVVVLATVAGFWFWH